MKQTTLEILNYFVTGNRPKVLIQSIVLAALCLVMFNAGRVIEQDNYVKALDEPYPLRPQVYFGGISIKHLNHTW